MLVDAPINHSPRHASVVLVVDESESRWEVNLPKGISSASKRISIVPIDMP